MALSVLINQFVSQRFANFTGLNFQDILHHVCDVSMTKTCADQWELVNEGVQID